MNIFYILKWTDIVSMPLYYFYNKECLMVENGWKLILPSKEKKGAVDAHFLCKCGQQEIVPMHHTQEGFPHYACGKCDNELFLSYEAFIDPTQHLYVDNLNHSTRTFMDETGWHIALAYKVPVYDYTTSAFRFETRVVMLVTLSYQGELFIEILDEHIEEKRTWNGKVSSKLIVHLRNMALSGLASFTISNKPKQLEWLTTEMIKEFKEESRLRLLSFFLQNSSLKEVAFYFWKRECFYYITEVTTSVEALELILSNREEKSIRRSLFRSYEEQMSRESRHYDPTFDYVVLRTFKNPNYLTMLLSLPPEHKNNLFAVTNALSILEAAELFKEHYAEKELFALYKQAIQDKTLYRLWGDCFRMLSNRQTLSIYRAHFERQKPKVRLVHDELVRIQNLYIAADTLDMLKPFDYEEQYLEAQSAYMGMDFVLPSTAKTLHGWGKDLHNCMFSYANAIKDRRSVIYGIFKEKRLTYAVEMRGRNIIQAKAVNNSCIAEDDRTIIENWRKERFSNRSVIRVT